MSISNLHLIDDIRVDHINELPSPGQFIAQVPASDDVAKCIYNARQTIHRILHGADQRLLVIVGPCSIHDDKAALEYAQKLQALSQRLSDDLFIVMRVYFEKPRTTLGWKGLINDPDLDNSFQINRGLIMARTILRDITSLGLACGTEFLDTIIPQYTADLVAWGAIGARTTESQVHRELASGLSCPVGFKNGTDGNVRIAVDAIRAARSSHHFLSINKDGKIATVATLGNEDGHLILRGGKQPNYDREGVGHAAEEMSKAGLAARLLIDLSHGNSQKQPMRQIDVTQSIAQQLADGDERIIGVMIESHLLTGRQDLIVDTPLTYGLSITDACLGWEESVGVLETLAAAVRDRRRMIATRED